MEKANYDLKKEIHNRKESQNPYTEQEIYSIIIQIISTLEYLYKNDMAPKDINPSNILVFKEVDKTIYKISDLRISKFD